MKAQADRNQAQNQTAQSAAGSIEKNANESNPLSGLEFVDNRVESIAQRKLQEIAQNGSMSGQTQFSQKPPIQREEIEVNSGAKGELTQKQWISAWQSDAIEKSMTVFFSDVFEKGLFTDRITKKQQTAILENYQELINNSLDQALRLHLADPDNVGLGLSFGASIKKLSGEKPMVILKIWDNKGGFPLEKLGKQVPPEEHPIAKVRDENSLYLGGLGIGTQRMIKNVADAGGQVIFQNGDFGKGKGAVVIIGFQYIPD